MCVTHDKTEKLKKVLNSSAGLLFHSFRDKETKSGNEKIGIFTKGFKKYLNFTKLFLSRNNFVHSLRVTHRGGRIGWAKFTQFKTNRLSIKNKVPFSLIKIIQYFSGEWYKLAKVISRTRTQHFLLVSDTTDGCQALLCRNLDIPVPANLDTIFII